MCQIVRVGHMELKDGKKHTCGLRRPFGVAGGASGLGAPAWPSKPREGLGQWAGSWELCAVNASTAGSCQGQQLCSRVEKLSPPGPLMKVVAEDQTLSLLTFVTSYKDSRLPRLQQAYQGLIREGFAPHGIKLEVLKEPW